MNSWINQIENELLSKGIQEAAIIGVDGLTLAKSREFLITEAQFKFLATFDMEEFFKKGIKVGLWEFSPIAECLGEFLALNKKHCLYVVKTDQLYIVALYDKKRCRTGPAIVGEFADLRKGSAFNQSKWLKDKTRGVSPAYELFWFRKSMMPTYNDMPYYDSRIIIIPEQDESELANTAEEDIVVPSIMEKEKMDGLFQFGTFNYDLFSWRKSKVY
ncbi:hypothetical protein QYM36_008445 [Artemia franciscana]|uniref:Uncharacterized protein n=1 Tax=Artemia franciscana TaxID=6661 RepID=A0AA88IF01_ARTSF|nr:hypothetical protein QYM36_000129 [Artemia franciscana]KAK2727970.1 hypothetical protein QYM36_008445 [Artemia franciscana]